MGRVAALVAAVLFAAYAAKLAMDSGSEPARERSELVPITSADEVLAMIRDGKKVVFVDARERREWQEERIPGAVNLTLREVSAMNREMLGDPDLIVAYCLKDFRGVEVAKALARVGFNQAGILGELGLNGWKQKGLPTAVAGKRSDQEAAAALLACANDTERCAKGKL